MKEIKEEMDIEKLKEIYSEELKRKDKVIEELKEQNTVIMKSALSQSKKIDELTKKLEEEVKKKK